MEIIHTINLFTCPSSVSLESRSPVSVYSSLCYINSVSDGASLQRVSHYWFRIFFKAADTCLQVWMWMQDNNNYIMTAAWPTALLLIVLLKWGEVPDPPVVCAFLCGPWSKELGSTGWDLQLGRLRGQWNGSLALSGGTGVERWVCSFVTHKPTEGNGASLARETKVRRRGVGVEPWDSEVFRNLQEEPTNPNES